jgi:hypothetical protein
MVESEQVVDIRDGDVQEVDPAQAVEEEEYGEEEESVLDPNQTITSGKKGKKGGNKNRKVIKIVNMIFDKMNMPKVKKLETEFQDGSK